MSGRLGAIALAVVVTTFTARVHACSCDPPSLRQLMASFDTVAEIEIGELTSSAHATSDLALLGTQPQSQSGIAIVRQRHGLREVVVGQRLPLTHAYGNGDSCGIGALVAGERWLVPIAHGRIAARFEQCSPARRFEADADGIIDALGQEFAVRRLMQPADWSALMQPLIDRLQPSDGQRDGCVARIDGSPAADAIPFGRFTLGARECAQRWLDLGDGGWLVAEDVRAESPTWYGAAIGRKRPTVVFVVTLTVQARQLRLDPQTIDRAPCATMANGLRLDQEAFCRRADTVVD
ncbi:MAG: hypothetical protein R3F15_17040 [Lysobacterales bacterium]